MTEGIRIDYLPGETNIAPRSGWEERVYTVNTGNLDGLKRFSLRAERLTPRKNRIQRTWYDVHQRDAGLSHGWYKVLIMRWLNASGRVSVEATVYSPAYVAETAARLG